VARSTLGRALLAMGRREDGIREVGAAVAVADALGNPTGRWRARADLSRALEAAGDEALAASELQAAAEIIRGIGERLANERRRRFFAALPVASVLSAAG
jgi:hypothetical protein